MDYFISRCTRSERCTTRSLSLSLSYMPSDIYIPTITVRVSLRSLARSQKVVGSTFHVSPSRQIPSRPTCTRRLSRRGSLVPHWNRITNDNIGTKKKRKKKWRTVDYGKKDNAKDEARYSRLLQNI